MGVLPPEITMIEDNVSTDDTEQMKNEDVSCPGCGGPGLGNNTDHETYGCYNFLIKEEDCRVVLFVPEGRQDAYRNTDIETE